MRYAIARDCIEAGLHTLLEKPPGVTLGEVEALARLARERGVTLFTTWHAQHNPAVPSAARALEGRAISSMRIVWREDVRKWHPGQQWIWQAGGLGVFDPGIIACRSPAASFRARLSRGRGAVLPREQGRADRGDAPVHQPRRRRAAHRGVRLAPQRRRSLDDLASHGRRRGTGAAQSGTRLFRGGTEVEGSGIGEYSDIYRRFGDLIDGRESRVDLEPLRLAADAFLTARRTVVEPCKD